MNQDARSTNKGTRCWLNKGVGSTIEGTKCQVQQGTNMHYTNNVVCFSFHHIQNLSNVSSLHQLH